MHSPFKAGRSLFLLITLLISHTVFGQAGPASFKMRANAGLLPPLHFAGARTSPLSLLGRVPGNKLECRFDQKNLLVAGARYRLEFPDKALLRLVNLTNGRVWDLQSLETSRGSVKRDYTIREAVELKGRRLYLKFGKGLTTLTLSFPDTGFISCKVENNFSGPGQIRLNFKGGGNFFGGGEHFIESRLNGHVLVNRPRDHIWLPLDQRNVQAMKRDEPGYLPIPFILTETGMGLYVDQSRTVTIDLENTLENRFSINTSGPETVLYLFCAKTPKEVLSSYTALVGRTPLSADWTFGVWCNLLEGSDSVLSKARKLKEANIPVDALWLFDFDDPASNTGWTYWTKGYYGPLRTLTDSLHKMGFKVLTYLRPFVNTQLFHYPYPNPEYTFASKEHLLIETANFKNLISFNSDRQVNFLNEATLPWWDRILAHNLQTEGFDGWMEDFGDICYLYDLKSRSYRIMPLKNDTAFSRGLDPEQRANLYPLLYHRATHLLASARKKQVVEFSRSGSAGSAAFTPVVWGGDQEGTWDSILGYPSVISAGISAGLSGYGVWAPDILSRSASRELWMRWVEFGAYCPVMRDHLWDYLPGNIRMWTDRESMNFFRKYALLHQKLKPYLIEKAREAHETGIPVMRHLMLEFPEDTVTSLVKYEYMLGERFLVAPVVKQGARRESVYLPPGRWQLLETQTVFQGPRWIEVDAPPDVIPVFEKL